MIADDHCAAKELFWQLLQLPPDERPPALEQLTATRPDLRDEILSLLAAHDAAGNFLEVPSADSGVVPHAGGIVGQTIGSYRLDALIAAGGMGSVYRGFDNKLNRPVALKLLSGEVAGPAARRRFEREARAAAALNHPHIVAVFDAGEADGQQYLVTEFVDGGTLSGWAAHQRRDWRDVMQLLVPVSEALAAAHDAGILHRDIKPENILVGRNGYAKLADFGLATLLHENHAAAESSPPGRTTAPGLVFGTIAYMSPEQAAGRTIDARSDIFSFGVVLYEQLARRRPFAAASDFELLQRVIDCRVEPLPPAIPASVAAAVEKALERDPIDRFASMREFTAALQAAERDPAALVPRRARRAARVVTSSGRTVLLLLTAAVVALSIALASQVFRAPAATGLADYLPVTSFTDSAIAPALSPDGRTVAFYRSDSWWQIRGDIYIKALPAGEPVLLVRDPRPKYGLAFSPDGSTLAYTVSDKDGYSSYQVPVRGGQPALLMANAAGLNWLDPHHLLFSEVRSGFHMGVVRATDTRESIKDIYFPADVRGMAHYSYSSPDRAWALVVEMDPVWQPCRLVSLDAPQQPRQVGPAGHCTSAGWSPDGRWMYFGVEMDGARHLWRQRFPNGVPEQLTRGLTEEQGIAVAPDGRSLITSIGLQQTAVWMHTSEGDQPLTSEGSAVSVDSSSGFGSRPVFSADGRRLYYLRRGTPAEDVELRRLDLLSQQTQTVVSGFPISEYDISPDERDVVFSTQSREGTPQLWLAAIDRAEAPRSIAASGEISPHFGPTGEILVRRTVGPTHYLATVLRDGSTWNVVSPVPIATVLAISPDRRWVAVLAHTDDAPVSTLALSTVGEEPHVICTGPCPVVWAPDGRFVYLSAQGNSGKTLALRTRPGEMLPDLPSGGISASDVGSALAGVRMIDRGDISPANDPSVYAYVKATVHRNLYRIPLE